jgi:hypothetical protein
MADRTLSPELRWLFAFFAALALGAFLLLFVLSEQTDDSFSWTIQPPLTAAFLGACYLGASLLFAWTVRRGGARSARAALLPVGLIAILLLVATIVHEDRFHDDLFGWFWRIAYVVAPIAILVVLVRELRRADVPSEPVAPLPLALCAVLSVQGAAMLGIGAYLFAAPESADSLWPWALTPLTARAVGAFLVGFGISALHAVLANDVARFEGAAIASAGLATGELVALARYRDDLSGADVDTWVFVAFLVSMLLAGLYGWQSARRLRLAR